MPEARFGTALDKIRQRRRFLFELVLIALLFAVCINLFSTAVVELIRPDGGNVGFWRWVLGISGGLLVLAVLAALRFAFMKTAHEETAIGITLPLRVDPVRKTVSVEALADYEPADQARKAFAFKKSEAAPLFFEGWPGCEKIRRKEFGPGNPCWDLLAELMDALLLIMLREFCDRSLTHSAMFYSVFRRFADKIPNRQVNREEWPARLKPNRFLRGRKINQVRLPEWVRLETPPPTPKPGGKPLERQLRLAAKNGSLTFSVIPYWTTLRGPLQLAERFQLETPEQLCFLRIVMDVRQVLRGGFVSRKGLFSDDSEMTLQYLWFQALVRNAFLHMDWGRWLRGEGGPDDDD